MSTDAMQAVWARKLPHDKKCVLWAFAWFIHPENGLRVWPSLGTVAQMCGYSLRQVRRIVATLVDSGILVRERQRGRIHGYVIEYSIHLDRAELLPDSVTKCHPMHVEQSSSNALATAERVTSAPDSRTFRQQSRTSGHDSVTRMSQEQYLSSKEQKRIVASKVSILDSQNQPQQQNPPNKGKTKAGDVISPRELLRDLPHVVGSKARKSPLHDDEAYEARMAELKAQEPKALEIVAKMQQESGKK